MNTGGFSLSKRDSNILCSTALLVNRPTPGPTESVHCRTIQAYTKTRGHVCLRLMPTLSQSKASLTHPVYGDNFYHELAIYSQRPQIDVHLFFHHIFIKKTQLTKSVSIWHLLYEKTVRNKRKS